MEADLLELYAARAAHFDEATARRLYWRDMLSVCWRTTWNTTYHYPTERGFSMWRNYLRIAVRTMRKHKAYAFINISGLAIGLACCFLIFLYVADEFSYDRYHAHADRIVRIAEDLRTESELLHQATSAPAMGPAFVRDFPEVLAMVRLDQANYLLEYKGQQFQEDHLFFADSTVFDIFSFDVLRGDPQTALVAPHSIVLTESAAQKYFDPGEDPIGRVLTDVEGDRQTFTVTGVMADVPQNSHFTFDGLISMTTRSSARSDFDDIWFWNGFYTYLLLPEGYDKADLEAKVPAFIERHIGERSREIGMAYEQLPLIPLTDIHLTSHRIWEIQPNGNRTYLYIFSAVAVFILLIACVNFMNLATARSAERAKEVGMRKVVGARRIQLAGQFLSESFMMTTLAAVLALGLCWLLMPTFNNLTEKSLHIGQLLQGVYALALVGLIASVGMVAGLYPAVVLSGFRPIRVLKGQFRTSAQGAWLRKGLVVFQFGISIVLIVGTAVVIQQLTFLQNQNLGFTQERMLVLNYNYDDRVNQQAEAIKQQYLAHPAITHAGMSTSMPGSANTNMFTRVDVREGVTQAANLDYYPVGFDFLDTYGIEVIAGRGFSRDFPVDTVQSLVINEALLAHFGWQTPEEALDRAFHLGRDTYRVIGVIQDFNYKSLHRTVQPLALFIRPEWGQYLALRLETENLQQTMADIEQVWTELVPHRPFDAVFLDDYFNRQYRAEERFATLFRYFAGLAILIACLGLFGLASFTAQQRTKEIGVRKVLGASVWQVLVLLSRDFALLVTVAFMLAVPVAYIAMNQWLTSFAYRMDLDVWVFVVAGVLAFLIAGLTVSYQAIKAAVANPVQSLRYE